MNCSVLLALLCCVAIGELVQARHSNLHEWAKFKQQHGKVYADRAEDSLRFSLFLAAKEKVAEHNANERNSFKLSLNHLSDWTLEERAKLNGLRYDADEHKQRLKLAQYDPFLRSLLEDDPAKPVPDELDWRQVAGRVSEVKDQGLCGSCWAFATTGALEGQQMVRNLTKGGKMVPLSEQDLVDCSDSNVGCSGGLMSAALNDIHDMGGIESEKDYPYVGTTIEKCKFDKKKVVLTDSGSVDLPAGDEEALKKVLANFGPVAVAVEANQKFENYNSGVFNDPNCGDELNHGVLLVGYGTDAKHGDFWLVKNSWGNSWGENGYIRLARGKHMCGISKLSTIPKFTDKSN